MYDTCGDLPLAIKIPTFRRKMHAWFTKFGRDFPWRKRSVSKYELIVTEVLLQRTRAEVVSRFFKTFFNNFPSWKKLADANVSDIGQIIRPIGLWKRRAVTLKQLATTMVERNGKFPRTRLEVEALPGVGQYITNATLLLCHDEAQPLLDVNMARVLERVFGPRKLADIRYDPYLQNLASEIVQCGHAKELNWAILDLAATTCRTNRPRCDECPLVSICITGKAIAGPQNSTEGQEIV